MTTRDDVDVDELVGQPTSDVPKLDPDGQCNGKRWEKRATGNVFAGYCSLDEGWGRGEDVTDGRCKHHHGSGGARDGAGAPEGNDNAVKHGAFSDRFVDSLTEDELEEFRDARTLLDTPEGAQDLGRDAASLALIRFDRSGDERFLRRFESICEKFNIVPDDELTVNMPGVEEAILEDVRRHHEDE